MPAATPHPTRIRRWRVAIPNRCPICEETVAASSTMGPSRPIAPPDATVRREEALLTSAGLRCRTPSRSTTASRMSQPPAGPGRRVPSVRTRPARSAPTAGIVRCIQRGDKATAWTRSTSLLADHATRGKRMAAERNRTAAVPARAPIAAAQNRNRTRPILSTSVRNQRMGLPHDARHTQAPARQAATQRRFEARRAGLSSVRFKIDRWQSASTGVR